MTYVNPNRLIYKIVARRLPYHAVVLIEIGLGRLANNVADWPEVDPFLRKSFYRPGLDGRGAARREPCAANLRGQPWQREQE